LVFSTNKTDWHGWPLLIDPDNQAELWVKTIQNSQNVFTEKDVQQGTPDELDGKLWRV
jgi:hypothetical protein